MKYQKIICLALLASNLLNCQYNLTSYGEAVAGQQTYAGVDGVTLTLSQSSAWSYLNTFNGYDNGYDKVLARQIIEQDSTTSPSGVRGKINPSGSASQNANFGIVAIKNAKFGNSGSSNYSKITIDLTWNWGSAAGQQLLTVYQNVFFDVNANGLPEQAFYHFQFSRTAGQLYVNRIYATDYNFTTGLLASSQTDTFVHIPAGIGTLTTHTATLVIEPTSSSTTKVTCTVDGTPFTATNDAATNTGSNAQGAGISTGSIIPQSINGSTKTLTQMIHAVDRDSSSIRVQLTNGDTNTGNISSNYSPVLNYIRVTRSDVGPF